MGREKTTNMMQRDAFQASEPYPTQQTDLPGDRFSTDAQVAVASNTQTKGKGKIAPSVTSGAESLVASTATKVKKKMSIKPVSDTELSAGKVVGGVPLGDGFATMSVAGAQPSSIPGDLSRVPHTRGGARADDRYGKKISADNFVINNTISEQIETSFDEPKDLREAPDALQGYNGRKQFKSARSKKNYGCCPSSTLFERSVDFIGHGNVVHATGQVIGNIADSANYPQGADAHFVNQRKGNYLLNGLRVTITNGRVTGLSFDETNIVVPAPTNALEQANLNWQVDANNVAKAMVKMQTELGRETTDKWSPLGYVIEQPYEFGMLFHDGEAILGSLTGLSYRAAAHSLAYLQNKMGKEGVRGLASIAEWFGDNIANRYASEYYDQHHDIFNVANTRAGSAAAIISMFDSTAKYTTKADFINQPRSLKFHLQTVDNNINPFHAKKEFYKAIDKVFMFSTDDGTYNPVLPVHTTSEVKVMLPYSLNAWLEGWQNPSLNPIAPGEKTIFDAQYEQTGIRAACNYAYRDLRNRYDWAYIDPFVAGLCRWILRHEDQFVRAYTTNAEQTCNVYIPASFSNTSASMFAFMVCSASQDMAWERNVIFRDYLFAGDQGVYVWEDLSSMKDLNPLYSSQYTYVDYASPLKLGKLTNDSKIRLYWSEDITPRNAYYADATGTGLPNKSVPSYILPFYYNEESIDVESADGMSRDTAAMSFPIVRNGLNHEFVDSIYSMSERDVRLSLDRMVTVPVTTIIDEVSHMVTGENNAPHFHFSSLRYDENSDGRVIMTAIPDSAAATADYYVLSEYTYLATPRELGFIFTMPYCVSRGIADLIGEVTIDSQINGSHIEYMTSYSATGSQMNGQAIDRSASLSQRSVKCFATPYAYAENNQFVTTTGIVPAISCFIRNTIRENGANVTNEYSLINPAIFTRACVYGLRSDQLEQVTGVGNDAPCYVGNNTMFSLSSILWTLLQREYNPINLFEAAFIPELAGGSIGNGVCLDPLEFAIYFGFAGTLASDFTQDVLERMNIKDELGMFYYQDEFVKSSLIFRG